MQIEKLFESSHPDGPHHYIIDGQRRFKISKIYKSGRWRIEHRKSAYGKIVWVNQREVFNTVEEALRGVI